MAKKRNKRIKRSAALAVIIYVLGLIVFLPARLVVALLPLPEHIQVAGVEGTLWRGQAQQVRLQHKYLEQVNWHVFPLALVTGKLAADVHIGQSPVNPVH